MIWLAEQNHSLGRRHRPVDCQRNRPIAGHTLRHELPALVGNRQRTEAAAVIPAPAARKACGGQASTPDGWRRGRRRRYGGRSFGYWAGRPIGSGRNVPKRGWRPNGTDWSSYDLPGLRVDVNCSSSFRIGLLKQHMTCFRVDPCHTTTWSNLHGETIAARIIPR
jgi:hypothetical protein